MQAHADFASVPGSPNVSRIHYRPHRISNEQTGEENYRTAQSKATVAPGYMAPIRNEIFSGQPPHTTVPLEVAPTGRT